MKRHAYIALLVILMLVCVVSLASCIEGLVIPGVTTPPANNDPNASYLVQYYYGSDLVHTQTVKTGNLLSMIGSTCGALLGFYMTFVGRSDALSPGMLLIYLLLWTVPMLPLLSGADKM